MPLKIERATLLSHQVPKVLQFCYSILLVRVVFHVFMKKTKIKLDLLYIEGSKKTNQTSNFLFVGYSKTGEFFTMYLCNRSGPNCLQEIGTKTLQGFSCIIFRLFDGNIRFLALYFPVF